jgi:hypothetical protein
VSCCATGPDSVVFKFYSGLELARAALEQTIGTVMKEQAVTPTKLSLVSTGITITAKRIEFIT